MARHLLDNNYLILTSDHGELFERGVYGHVTPLLYEPIIRIPLLISKPGQKGRVDVYSPTSCVDILPTLASIAGNPIPDWCEGEILPGLGGRENFGRSIYAVEAKSNPVHQPIEHATIALIRPPYKLIYYFGYPGCDDYYELFDLSNDPEELTDLYDNNFAIAVELREELEATLNRVNQPYLR